MTLSFSELDQVSKVYLPKKGAHLYRMPPGYSYTIDAFPRRVLHLADLAAPRLGTATREDEVSYNPVTLHHCVSHSGHSHGHLNRVNSSASLL